jgi:hypothetical protein
MDLWLSGSVLGKMGLIFGYFQATNPTQHDPHQPHKLWMGQKTFLIISNEPIFPIRCK